MPMATPSSWVCKDQLTRSDSVESPFCWVQVYAARLVTQHGSCFAPLPSWA